MFIHTNYPKKTLPLVITICVPKKSPIQSERKQVKWVCMLLLVVCYGFLPPEPVCALVVRKMRQVAMMTTVMMPRVY